MYVDSTALLSTYYYSACFYLLLHWLSAVYYYTKMFYKYRREMHKYNIFRILFARDNNMFSVIVNTRDIYAEHLCKCSQGFGRFIVSIYVCRANRPL